MGNLFGYNEDNIIMVGLVIVSHSRALANALLQLTLQVAAAHLPIATAGGVGADRSEFGTDAVEISEAIQSVFSPDGVVVLMDLGSAVLSAQMAVELLPPEIAEKVLFCAAPLVEGCIAAAVQISLGSSAQEVCQEASGALQPKLEQLGSPAPANAAPTAAPSQPSPPDTLQVTLTLKNLHGLHARPAARFVQLASSFDAELQVRNERSGKGPIPAKSLNRLATLGAVKGDQVTILASGREARAALDALSSLVEDNFGETGDEAPLPSVQPARAAEIEAGVLQAEPISPGIAFGPLVQMRSARPLVTQERINDPAAAWDRLRQALRTTAVAVSEQRKAVARNLGEANAAIFDAHLLILSDPDLLERARSLLFEQKLNEAAAWEQAIQTVKTSYQELDDPYLRQRALDVADLGDQVLNALSGKKGDERIELRQPSILLAAELTPTQTAGLDLNQVLGLITTGGGPTSHSAILARAMGIPAVSGANPVLESLPANAMVAIDGSSGRIWTSPSPDQLASLEAQRQAWLTAQAELRSSSRAEATTQDNHRIEVAANIANLAGVEVALKNGAEGIGLLRTEFLFITRQTPPTEEEQYDRLSEIISRMGSLPVIVRTLDAGGDKELPYLNLPAEANPFLGMRAIRLCFEEPDLFLTQLRAILRAGSSGHLRIMFPMISGLDEVILARQFVEEAHQTLLKQGIRHAWPVETGIMVEIPSAALLSDALASQVDFFSIGTNDLTQYTLAAERGNPALTHLSDALHPAVLALIQKVAAAAHAHGKWVGVCGELAGDQAAVPVLVGLGVDELSLAPAGIPKIKAIVRDLNFAQAQLLAQQVLSASNANRVRELIKIWQAKQAA
jgi:phosphoenolpyruvate-protein phosphotransferase/dihydroxyacetone kinase phosphotransfer subunit